MKSTITVVRLNSCFSFLILYLSQNMACLHIGYLVPKVYNLIVKHIIKLEPLSRECPLQCQQGRGFGTAPDGWVAGLEELLSRNCETGREAGWSWSYFSDLTLGWTVGRLSILMGLDGRWQLAGLTLLVDSWTLDLLVSRLVPRVDAQLSTVIALRQNL